MIIELIQRDAHYCKVNTPKGVPIVAEILSYKETTTNRWTGFPEVIKKSFLDKRGTKFLCGLIPFVIEELTKRGYEVELSTIRGNLKHKLFASIDGITFEDYQKACLRRVGKNERGIIVGPTGMGKTIIAAGIINKYDIPVTLITTIKKSIFHGFIKDFQKWFPEVPIGMVGDDECIVGHITIAMYQSLSKWNLKELNNMVELYLCDEAHGVNPSIERILKQLTKCHNRFGLTATPHPKTDFKKWATMIGNLGPIIYSVTDEQCESRVVPCEVYMINCYVHNPEGSDYQEIFRKDVLSSKLRNRKLLNAANDMAISKGLTCLFLLHEVQQAEDVAIMAERMGLTAYVAHGKNKKGVNEEIKDALNNREVQLVISTQVFGTGTNIPNIDCVVLGSARKSTIEVIQNIGRGRRRTKNKERLIVIDCYDTVRNNSGNKRKKAYDYFQEHSDIRLELYKSKGWFKGKIK